jgi:hypothetical protein
MLPAGRRTLWFARVRRKTKDNGLNGGFRRSFLRDPLAALVVADPQGEIMWQFANWEMLRRSLYLLALIILLPVGSARSSRGAFDRSKPIDVGMVSLLANPKDYDHKLIRTIGFACLEYEGEALYLHEEDYQYQNYKNALALRFAEGQLKQFKSLSLKHVIVEGTIYANGLESSEYAGAIGNITRFELWLPRGDIPARPDEPQSHCSR